MLYYDRITLAVIIPIGAECDTSIGVEASSIMLPAVAERSGSDSKERYNEQPSYCQVERPLPVFSRLTRSCSESQALSLARSLSPSLPLSLTPPVAVYDTQLGG